MRLIFIIPFFFLSFTLFGSINPTGDLRMEVIAAYNFVVDSNSPTSGPSSAYVGVEVCNDGTDDLTNVVVNIGDFNAGTPGVYPVRTNAEHGYDGDLSFEHSGDCDGTDGTRFIGTIPAGECVTHYWLLEYPVVDNAGSSVVGGNTLSDDLWLNFDYWATADDGATPLAADDTWTVTMRSMISAMANKSAPNGDNKVPSEYLDAIEGELGWRPDIETASAGSNFELEGIWYDLGRINKGYDNDGDFIPDYNVFMQPVGDASQFDACCYRLTKTYGLIIVKLTDGTEHLIPFEDQLYFSNIPDNNNGAVGLVFYEFLPINAPCASNLTPYQCVASGSDNEKYNGDSGSSFGAAGSEAPDITFDKSGPVSSGGVLPVNLTYELSLTNNEATPVGLPLFSMPLVISDAIPAGTEYVAGTATSTGLPATTVLYSTDNGVTWVNSEPPANTVTNIQWWLDDVLGAAASVTASFDVTIPNTYIAPLVENEAGVGFGSNDPFITDDAVTIVEGPYSIDGTVFNDDGGTTGTLGEGTQDGDEGTIGNVMVVLFLDSNNDGIIDINDIPLDTVYSDPATGAYTFESLPDGNYLVSVDNTDTDIPTGYGATTDITIEADVSGANVSNIDYGFGPSLKIEKRLTSSDPIYEDQLVTYEIEVSNLIGGVPPVGPAYLEAWGTSAGAPNGYNNFTLADPFGFVHDSGDGPNGTFDGGDGSSILELTTFPNLTGIPDPGTAINKVEMVVTFYIVGVVNNDELRGRPNDDGSAGDFVSIPASVLQNYDDGVTSAANPVTLTIDISADANVATWAQLTGSQFSTQFGINTVQGSDGHEIWIDAIGVRVYHDGAVASTLPSDACTNIDPLTTLNPVPLSDTYDPNQLEFVSASVMPDVVDGGSSPASLTWNNIGPICGSTSEIIEVTFRAKAPTAPATGGEIVTNTASVTGATFAGGIPANDDTDTADATLQPAGSIGDLITNSNTGAGIPGIMVYLCSGTVTPCDASNAVASMLTDATGNYLFDGLLDGDYTIGVDVSSIPGTPIQTSDPDGTMDSETNISIVGANDNLLADFAYAVPNAVIGTVWGDMNGDGLVDAGDNGIAGVTVTLHDCGADAVCGNGDDGADVITTTDSSGAYSFGDLADSNYSVEIDNTSAPLGATYSNTMDPEGASPGDNNSDVFAVSGGQVYSGYDFGYNETGTSSIGDVLFVDWNGDGLQDVNSDEGISGVTVNLYEDSNGDGIIDPATDALIGTVTTGTDGLYSFDNLPAGDYIVLVDESTLPAGTASQTGDPDEVGVCTTCDAMSSVIGVDGTSTYNDNDFGYAPYGTGQIGDNVFVDSNSDGIQDPTETGLSNIDVILYADLDGDGNYTPVDTVTSDANGNYLFENLPDGNYQVLIDPAETDIPQDPYGNDAIITSSATQDVVVSGGEVSSVNGTACTSCDMTVDFGYAFPAAIGNTIFYDNNANGTQDLSETGIPGVTVYLCDVASATCDASTAIATQVTDANGEYLFTGVNAGEYNVVVDASTLPAGVSPSADPNSDGLACSDPDLITYGYDPCDDMADSVLVSYGTQLLGIDFGYEPSSVIGDYVWLDVNGDGIQDSGEPAMAYVDVVITPLAGQDLGAGAGVPVTVTTDSDGAWSFANLPDGDYTVSIPSAPAGYTAGYDADSGNDSSTAFTVTGGDVTDTNNAWCADAAGCDFGLDFAFELAGSNTISGSVCLDDGSVDGVCSTGGETMLPGTTIYLYNDDNTFLGSTTVDNNGDYSFTGLPDDNYFVVIGTTANPFSLAGLTTEVSDTPASTITNTGTSIYQTVPVSGGEITNVDFAFQINVDIDFGDLPGPYPTALTDGPVGAYHILDDPTSVFLGTTVDAETAPIRNLTATGDDANGSNDDDGIIFNSTDAWTIGTDGGNIDLTLGGINTEGYVVAYIDFNEDGDFSDPGEMILDTLLANGTHAALVFDIPAGTDLTSGNILYARFRVFEERPAFPQFAYSGEATKGEVEDYRIVIDEIVNTTLPIDDDEITSMNTPVDGNVMTNDLDPQGDGLTFTGFDNPADPGSYVTTGSVATIPGTDSEGNPVIDAGDLTVNPDGTYSFTPVADFVGTVEVPYLLCDDGTPQACETAILQIEVLPISDPTITSSNSLIAIDDDNVTFVNVPVSGGLLSNDNDPESDAISFIGLDDGTGSSPTFYQNTGTITNIVGTDMDGMPVADAGDLVINPDGTYTFTPTTDFVGQVEIPYEICDDATSPICVIATLKIDVLPDANPADNNPPFAGDDFASTPVDAPVDGDFIGNDTDVNMDEISVNGTQIDPTDPAPTSIGTYPTEQGGTIELFSDGTYTYTPLAGYMGPDSYAYEICDITAVDPKPLCDFATINLLVLPIYYDFSDLDASIYLPASHQAAIDSDGNYVPDAINAFWLGDIVDYEAKETSNSSATGDDLSTVNDDDGLIIPETLTAGTDATFTVTVNSNTSGKTVHFGLWIDWDNNGSFEAFYKDSGVTNSPTDVDVLVSVPVTYTGGIANFRVRAFDAEPVASDFSGEVKNGEVEDYQKTVALPVELSRFVATAEGCHINFNWTSQTEENFSHYELEQSENGNDYTLVKKVEAQGGTQQQHYQFFHKQALPKGYYRLKMVDIDGSVAYSKIRQVTTDCDEELGLILYPNPVPKSSAINVKFFAKSSDVNLTFMDMHGRVLKKISIENLEKEWATVIIDLDDLPSGSYYLHIEDQGYRISKAFIIQE